MKLYNILKDILEVLKRISRDYTVEEGVAGNWQYVKRKNGKIRLNTVVRLSPNVVNASGQVYYSKHGYDIPTSLTLIGIDNIQGTLKSDWIGGITIDPASTNNKINFYCWTSRNASRDGFDVHLTVAGRWK